MKLLFMHMYYCFSPKKIMENNLCCARNSRSYQSNYNSPHQTPSIKNLKPDNLNNKKHLTSQIHNRPLKISSQSHVANILLVIFAVSCNNPLLWASLLYPDNAGTRWQNLRFSIVFDNTPHFLYFIILKYNILIDNVIK